MQKELEDNFFDQILKNYFFSLATRQILQGVLQRFLSADSRISDLVGFFQGDLSAAGFVRDYVTAKVALPPAAKAEGEKDAPPPLLPLSHVLLLLGAQRGRSLLVAYELIQAAELAFPKNTVLDVKSFNIDSVLKYALQIEEYCKSSELGQAEIAFVVGLLYDWFTELTTRHKGSKPVQDLIEQLWKRSIYTGKILYFLNQKSPHAYSKYSFAAGLVHSIGKPLMALLFEGYASALAKVTGSFETLLLWERSNYSLIHEELSSLCCSFSPVLQPIEKAVRYYREPYYLKEADPSSYPLAVLMNAATSLSESGKLSSIQQAWLKPLKITEKEITKILASTK